jgi:hypothetical protein
MALSDDDIPATMPLTNDGGAANQPSIIATLIPQEPCISFPKMQLSTAAPELVLGRRPTCNVVLQSAHASGRHARFTATKQPGGCYGVWLTDMRWVNWVFCFVFAYVFFTAPPVSLNSGHQLTLRVLRNLF